MCSISDTVPSTVGECPISVCVIKVSCSVLPGTDSQCACVCNLHQLLLRTSTGCEFPLPMLEHVCAQVSFHRLTIFCLLLLLWPAMFSSSGQQYVSCSPCFQLHQCACHVAGPVLTLLSFICDVKYFWTLARGQWVRFPLLYMCATKIPSPLHVCVRLHLPRTDLNCFQCHGCYSEIVGARMWRCVDCDAGKSAFFFARGLHGEEQD